MFNEKNVSTIMEWGFTLNQAKVYLALIVLGPSSAKKVQDFTGLAKEEIYRKIVELEKKGVVKRTFSRPVIFEAVNLESTSQTMLKSKAEKLSNITEKTTEMLEVFEENKKRENLQTYHEEIKLIPPRRALEELVKKELEKVTTSLDTICPWEKGIDWISSHNENFIKCLKRNVQIRVIIERNGENDPNFGLQKLQKYPKFHFRMVNELPPACMGLYDQKKVIIDTVMESGFIKTPCLWSNNIGIVGMAQIYFETVWKKALLT